MANFWNNIHLSTPALGVIDIEKNSTPPLTNKTVSMRDLNRSDHANQVASETLIESKVQYIDGTSNLPPSAPNINSIYAGEAVCVITGQKHLKLIDFSIDGPIRIEWVRYYSSANHALSNMGYGWRHSFSDQIHLVDQHLIYTDGQGQITRVPDIPIGETIHAISAKLCIHRYDANTIRLWSTITTLTITKQFTQLGLNSNNYYLSYISDSVGNYWQCEYDKGRLTGLLSSWGLGLQLSYDSDQEQSNFIVDIQRYTRNEFSEQSLNVKTLMKYRYDIYANQIAAIDAAGHQEKYSYQRHLLTQHSLKTGYTFTFEWQRYHRQDQCVRSYGEALNGQAQRDRRFSYDRENRHTVVIDARSGKRQYFYNERHQLIKQIMPEGGVIKIIYDARGNLSKIINPLEQSTCFAYDSQNRLIGIEDPLKQKQTFRFNPQGQLTEATDQAGHTTIYKYNGQGLLISTTDPLGQTLYYQYNPLGLPTSITDNEGGGIVNQWDQYGRLITQQQLDDKPIQIRYTAYDQIESLEKDSQLSLHYRYDDIGHVSQITDVHGRRASFRYNPAGLITEHTSLDGKTVQYEYHSNHQLSKRIDVTGHTIQCRYDGEGNQIGVINEAGDWYQFEYDLNNNLIEEIGFDGRIKRYEYNSVNQLIAAHECRKPETSSAAIITETTTFERDALGRTIEQRGQDGHSQHYSYNQEGKLVLAVNQHTTIGFSYDALGRLNSEIQGDVTIQHEYDNHNRKILTQLPDKQVLRYEYGDGEIQTWLNKKCINHSYYDNFGQEIKRVCGDFNSEFQYDSLGRLSQQRASIADPPKQLIQRDYQYDADSGLLHTIADSNRGNTHYQYDAAEQLISVNNRHPEQFVYDPTGNLLSTSTQRSADPLSGNRLETFGDHQFSYDSKGNLIRKSLNKADTSTTEYHYNDLNQLTELTKADQTQTTVSYEYDALGRRIKKIDAQGTTRFLWNGNQLLSEQRDESKTLYLFEQDSFRPLAMVQNDTLYHIQTDHLGTPQELVTESGELVWAAYYTAFGKTKQEFSIGISCPLRFQGQYYDDETGLHYNRHRYYDPDIGRFISQDPIGLLGGLNSYRYVPNPVRWVDPLGLEFTMSNSERDSLERYTRIRTPITNEHARVFGPGRQGTAGEYLDLAEFFWGGAVNATQESVGFLLGIGMDSVGTLFGESVVSDAPTAGDQVNQWIRGLWRDTSPSPFNAGHNDKDLNAAFDIAGAFAPSTSLSKLNKVDVIYSTEKKITKIDNPNPQYKDSKKVRKKKKNKYASETITITQTVEKKTHVIDSKIKVQDIPKNAAETILGKVYNMNNPDTTNSTEKK